MNPTTYFCAKVFLVAKSHATIDLLRATLSRGSHLFTHQKQFWKELMADNTAIEWTDATWNPITGCSKVSRGCDNCYAERFAERFRGIIGHPYEQGFDLKLWPNRLEIPLNWTRPRRVFVNSMSDLFHKEVKDPFISSVFDVMERANWHVFQLLSKRSSRLRDFINHRFSNTAPNHVWIGVSVEDRNTLLRIEHLRRTNAAVRFLSLEPLLEDLGTLDLTNIHWVIVGGESGPRSRPIEGRWVQSIRDQCLMSKVPFFFKQWGGIRPKSGGNSLDGQQWLQYPQREAIQTFVQ